MQTQTSLFARDDTFFGVCQGLGEDLGFNPDLLRVALCAALFFSPVAVLATYAALGMVVAFTRWYAPRPVVAAAAEPAAEAAVAPPEPMQVELPLAA